jgi:hypothetical protein
VQHLRVLHAEFAAQVVCDRLGQAGGMHPRLSPWRSAVIYEVAP